MKKQIPLTDEFPASLSALTQPGCEMSGPGVQLVSIPRRSEGDSLRGGVDDINPLFHVCRQPSMIESVTGKGAR